MASDYPPPSGYREFQYGPDTMQQQEALEPDDDGEQMHDSPPKESYGRRMGGTNVHKYGATDRTQFTNRGGGGGGIHEPLGGAHDDVIWVGRIDPQIGRERSLSVKSEEGAKDIGPSPSPPAKPGDSKSDPLKIIQLTREGNTGYKIEDLESIRDYATSIDKIAIARERSPFVKYAVLVAANMQEQENTYLANAASNQFVRDKKRQINETNRQRKGVSQSPAHGRIAGRGRGREGGVEVGASAEEKHYAKQLTIHDEVILHNINFANAVELELQVEKRETYQSLIRLILRVKTESLVEMGLAQIGRVIRPNTHGKDTDDDDDENIAKLTIQIIEDSTGRSILAHAIAAHMIRERIDIRNTSQSRMKRNDILIHNETSIRALVNYLRSKSFVMQATTSKTAAARPADHSMLMLDDDGDDMGFGSATYEEQVRMIQEMSKRPELRHLG